MPIDELVGAMRKALDAAALENEKEDEQLRNLYKAIVALKKACEQEARHRNLDL